MFGNWLRRWRIRRHSRRLWQFVGQGEISAALELYEQRLAPEVAEVPKPVRAAYHLHRWLDQRESGDLQAAKRMAAEAPQDSHVQQVWSLLQRLRRQVHLARAIEQQDPELLSAPPTPGASEGEQALEDVGLVVLRLLGLRPDEASREELSAAAHSALAPLPPAEALPEPVRGVRAHVCVWAWATLQRYEQIVRDTNTLAALPQERREEVARSAALRWAQDALPQGEVGPAIEALGNLRKLLSPEQVRAVALRLGLMAWAADASSASLHWFTHLFESTSDSDPRSWRWTLLLAMAIAQLRCASYAEARRVLDGLSEELSSADEAWKAGAEGLDLRERALCQVRYLLALSFLAATRDWATPSGLDDAESRESDREILVRNRSLWGALREELLLAVQRLEASPAALAWRAHQLAGLIAYVDRNITLDLDQIDLFSAAIDYIESETARTQLRAIEGDLLSKAKATEEAINLIQRKEWRLLREHNDTVLTALADAIPSLVRAMVYMTLWQADPTYDPLPDLYRVPLQPSDEALIGQCTAQVRISHALRQLAQECMRTEPSGQAPPALEPLMEFDERVGRTAALALATVSLRDNDLGAAEAALAEIGEAGDTDVVTYLRFYLAWRKGDTRECHRLADADEGVPRLLPPDAPWQDALLVRRLVAALSEPNEGEAEKILGKLESRAREGTGLSTVFVRFGVWLLERREPRLTQRLVSVAQRETLTSSCSPQEREQLAWVCRVLSVFVAAQLGQYTACLDRVTEVLEGEVPQQTPFGTRKDSQRVADWVSFLGLEAELALAAESSDDPATRLRAVQRAVAQREEALEKQPLVQPYVFLLHALVTHLSADILVDEATIMKLRYAQHHLPLVSQAGFIEEVVGRLTWRKRVIEEFWRRLSTGDFKQSRLIYQEELLPDFGERMPPSIELGIVMADWGSGTGTTQELLDRLDLLEREAAELSRELIEKVRSYILDGDKVRHLIRLLEGNQFDELIEAANTATWADLDPGQMPVPVAVVLLYAYFKKKQGDEARRMGEAMQAQRLAPWVKDYGSLLLGYVLFDQEEYAEAAAAFEQISVSEILGHDADKYWAAAHFSNGIQLLKVGQTEQAFQAFARSLQKRGGSEENVNLAPLFVHFGLDALQTQHGNRAVQAFELLEQSLEGVPPTAEVVYNRLVAEMGRLLCEGLIESDIQHFGGDRFLKVVDRLDAEKELADEGARKALERDLRILAICQQLRAEERRPKEARQSQSDLRKYLAKQVKALQTLSGEDDHQDPVLFVLRGLMELMLKSKPSKDRALEYFEQAIKLGVGSQRLTELIQRHRSLLEEAAKKHREALDMFDEYLASGSVPAEVRSQFVRSDDLVALYRLTRRYRPHDVVTPQYESGVDLLASRLKKLLDYLESPDAQGDEKLQQRRAQLQEHLEELCTAEKELLQIEKEVLDIVATRIRDETLGTT